MTTGQGLVFDRLEVPNFAGTAVRGTWLASVSGGGGFSLLNSFAITLNRPGVNGIAYANLIDVYEQIASNSYNVFVNQGDSLRALASLFYYYAFVGFYQGELDQNPALRDFSYYFFLAHYYLNIEYANGNADEAVRLYYEQLAYAYFRFYFLSGYPGEAQNQFQYYRGLSIR